MRNAILLSVLSIVALACQPGTNNIAAPATTGGDSAPALVTLPEVVAEVNGEKIGKAELEDAASGQLSRLRGQVYETYKVALDGLIGDKLLTKAAQEAGKSPEEYLKQEIDNKITAPTEDELKKFYEQRKSQMGGKKYDEIKPQIVEFLKNTQRQRLQQQLAQKLKSGATIVANLQPPRVKVDGGDAPAKGDTKAPVQIIEWSDYECPFCGRSRATVKEILDTYGDKVHYVFRDFPLDFHKQATKAHEAAHCAGDQGKYWEMNAHLFANQKALEVSQLKEYAKTLGLKTDEFNQCLDSGKHTKRVETHQDAGQAVGVTGTPSFFVNGIPLSGARPFADFKKVIDEELARK